MPTLPLVLAAIAQISPTPAPAPAPTYPPERLSRRRYLAAAVSSSGSSSMSATRSGWHLLRAGLRVLP
jgi:hypothetical protein